MSNTDDNKDFDINDLPPLPQDDPIAELLGTRVVDMNDEELDKFVKEMRTVVEAPQSFRALLKNHGMVESKPKKVAKAAAKNILTQLDL